MGNIPNFPNLVTQWGASFGANGGTPAVQNVDLSSRVLTSQSWKVGKQYELDSAQAGELTVTLRNNDAVLDPTNGSSPFAGHIAPYQSLSVYACYPPSVNRLTQEQAGGGHGWPVGAVPASFDIYTGTDPTGTGTIVAQPAAPLDSAFSFAVPAGTPIDLLICAYLGNAVEPDATYAFSTNLLNTTAGVSGAVKIAFGWYDVGSTSGPSSWSYGPTINLTPNTVFSVSATGTAPADATGLAIGIVAATAVAAAFNVETWFSQLELGSAVTAFSTPGTRYPLFSGWVERWPTQWRDGGQYGTISATGVDVMALLSQGQLTDPLTAEINALSPRFLFRLDDPQGANQAAEANGKFPPLNVVSGSNGAGSFTFGNSITANDPVNGIFVGSANAACATVVPAMHGVGDGGIAASMLSMTDSGIIGPATPLSWTRMVAVRYTGTGTNSDPLTLWSVFDKSAVYARNTGHQILLFLDGTYIYFQIVMSDADTSTAGNFSNTILADSNWHLIVFGYNDTTANLFISVDGSYQQTSTASGSGGYHFNAAIDTLGGYLDPTGSTPWEFQGDLAYAAEFPEYLSASQVSNLYKAWRNAYSGDTAAQRYSRILGYAGYTGPSNIGAGVMTTSMGPATDLSGSDALSCLENVVQTENGTHWVAADGTLTFVGRAARYNRATPSFIFGENAAGGEWPYEDLKLDYDPTHLANDVAVTNNSTGQLFYASDSTSQAAYFDRTMTRTVNVTDPQEAQDAASFLAWRYSQPLTRVSSITLNPSGLGGLWPVALSLDIGDCIQINRRPPGCPTISLLVWIENRQWTLSDNGDAKLVLQCSPAITVPQAQFTVWRTVLASSAASGQATITVSPPAADTVNPLDGYISPGMQLYVESEVKTVKSVQSTGSNWSTGTITFTSNLASNHSAGATVAETGSTSLTQYDTSAQFDSVTFTY